MSALEQINTVLVSAKNQLDAADTDCARAVMLTDDAHLNAAAIGSQDTMGRLDMLRTQIAQARQIVDSAKTAADIAASTAAQIARGA